MSDILDRYPLRATELNKTAHDTTPRSRRDLRKTTLALLKNTSGPLLEVGGPSASGFLAIDGTRLPNGLIISNAEPAEGASLVADVRDLPFAPRSLGGVLMRGLKSTGEDLRSAVLQEARLKVEPGGVLLTSTLLGREITLAEELGFKLEATTVADVNRQSAGYNIGEFVFSLSDLETPAGQLLEASPLAQAAPVS